MRIFSKTLTPHFNTTEFGKPQNEGSKFLRNVRMNYHEVQKNQTTMSRLTPIQPPPRQLVLKLKAPNGRMTLMEAAVAYSAVLCHHLTGNSATSRKTYGQSSERAIVTTTRRHVNSNTALANFLGSRWLVEQDRLFEECVNEGCVAGWGDGAVP